MVARSGLVLTTITMMVITTPKVLVKPQDEGRVGARQWGSSQPKVIARSCSCVGPDPGAQVDRYFLLSNSSPLSNLLGIRHSHHRKVLY